MDQQTHCVYCLYFPNGKRYFGIEKKQGSRISDHRRWGNADSIATPKNVVSKALKAVGWENVWWRHLAVNISREAAERLEILLIAAHGTQHRHLGYNVSAGGDNTASGTAGFKKKPSEESREKQSAALKDFFSRNPMTDEWKKKIGDAQKGKIKPKRGPMSEDHKRKIGAANKGKTVSQEQREAISRKLTGTKASEETRAKLSAFQTGRAKSDEHKAKLSRSHREANLAHKMAHWYAHGYIPGGNKNELAPGIPMPSPNRKKRVWKKGYPVEGIRLDRSRYSDAPDYPRYSPKLPAAPLDPVSPPS